MDNINTSTGVANPSTLHARKPWAGSYVPATTGSAAASATGSAFAITGMAAVRGTDVRDLGTVQGPPRGNPR